MKNFVNDTLIGEAAPEMRQSAAVARQPSMRITNQRLRSVGAANSGFNGEHMDESSNMVVTMSIEQSDEIAVATTSGTRKIASSHTRQISTMYDQRGMAIEVVCGSSTENHKVIMDMVPELKPKRRSAGRTGRCVKRSKLKNALDTAKVVELRAKLPFLGEEQFQRLLSYKVNELKDILKLTLLQVISIGLHMDHFELLFKIINESIMKELALCGKQSDFATVTSGANPPSMSVPSVAENIEDNLDDDDEKPLIIDEAFVNVIEEPNNKEIGVDDDNLRQLDEIENSLAFVRGEKIPKSRALVTDIRSELSHILADLNANEEHIKSKFKCPQANGHLTLPSTEHKQEDELGSATKALVKAAKVPPKRKPGAKRTRKVKAHDGRRQRSNAARTRFFPTPEEKVQNVIAQKLKDSNNDKDDVSVNVECSASKPHNLYGKTYEVAHKKVTIPKELQPTVLLPKLNPFTLSAAGLKRDVDVHADNTVKGAVDVSLKESKQPAKHPEETADLDVKKGKQASEKMENEEDKIKQLTARECADRKQASNPLINNDALSSAACVKMPLANATATISKANDVDAKPPEVASEMAQQQPCELNSLNTSQMVVVNAAKETAQNLGVNRICKNVFTIGNGLRSNFTDKKQTKKDTPQNGEGEASKTITPSRNKPNPRDISKLTTRHIAVNRRITFEDKQETKASAYLDDIDLVVTIASPPLSPLSTGIASPINAKANLSDYTPAKEIDCHLTYPPMMYILYEVDVPVKEVNEPKNLNALLYSNVADPRLKKSGKKTDLATQPTSPPMEPNPAMQTDPRRCDNVYNNELYTVQHPSPEQQTPNMLLYSCLQRSPWYQSLMSTMKIQINQTISILVRAINNFQKERLSDPYAVFDIFKLFCAGELLEILENLGLLVDVNGVIMERKNTSTFGGHTYANSSFVNSTYSFLPTMETTPTTAPNSHSYTMTPSTSQKTTPFVSCYIDSPPLSVNRLQQPTAQRRHCGLKAPYMSYTVNRSSTASSSQTARQLRYNEDDDGDECWDLDEVESNSNNNGYGRRSHNHHHKRPYERKERNYDQRNYNANKKYSYRDCY